MAFSLYFTIKDDPKAIKTYQNKYHIANIVGSNMYSRELYDDIWKTCVIMNKTFTVKNPYAYLVHNFLKENKHIEDNERNIDKLTINWCNNVEELCRDVEPIIFCKCNICKCKNLCKNCALYLNRDCIISLGYNTTCYCYKHCCNGYNEKIDVENVGI